MEVIVYESDKELLEPEKERIRVICRHHCAKLVFGRGTSWWLVIPYRGSPWDEGIQNAIIREIRRKPRMLTLKEYGKQNGIAINTVITRINKRQLPAEKFGRSYLIDERFVWRKSEPYYRVRLQWEREGLI